ncbi:cysteine proteinase [Apiospora arundinis]
MAPRRCTRVDSSSNSDDSDLDAADLDKALRVISPKVAQEIQDFRMSLGKIQRKQRIKRCQEKRDKLLSRSKDIEIAIICYELVFQTYSIKKHGKEWGNFDAFVVRSREASKRLKSLICLSDTWGTEVIEHYNFVSQYRTYCDELKVIARGINTWEDVVPKLNQSIDGRIRKNDGRARVKFSANPIERQDLTYVKNYVKTTEHRQLESPGLMPGYGLDKYGLIVREKFAAPLPVSPLPSASSQQHLNHDTIVSGNDPSQWEGSTLIPSSPPAKQMPLPSPSKSSEPTPSTPSQHDNSKASTTNVREQTTTPSTRSSSSLPGTSLSQLLPLPPATQLVVNGDVATGGNGRGGTHYTANGPIVAPSHPSPTCTSPLPSDVAASQSSPSSLSITRTSSEADTTTAICSSPLSPSPELSSTSSQRGPSKPSSASQNDDYSDVSIDWVERSGPPTVNTPAITIASLLSPLSPLSTSSFQPYYPRDAAQESVSPSPAQLVQGSTPLPQSLSEKAPSSLIEEPADSSSQGGNVHAIDPAAIPYSYPTGPPSSASLLYSQSNSFENDKPLASAEPLSIDSCLSSPLLVVPSTLKSAWLRDVPSSIHRLDEKGWLNDTIVNGYMHLITEHHNVCFLNSHFLERFDPSMKWRFENGKCPLEAELVLMPIHENSHWYLLVMYKRYFPATDHHERVVCFLDSLGASRHSSSFEQWTKYLKARGDRLPVQIKEVQVPQQTNTSDCGVFVLAFAEMILQSVQGFIEAIDGGKELGWEFDGQTLRVHIRDNLTLAADAEELIGK